MSRNIGAVNAISTLKNSKTVDTDEQTPISPISAEAGQFSLAVKENLEAATLLCDSKITYESKPRSTSVSRAEKLIQTRENTISYPQTSTALEALHSKATSPSGVFTLPQTAFDMRLRQSKASMRNSYTGEGKTHHPMIMRVRQTESCTIDQLGLGIETLRNRTKHATLQQHLANLSNSNKLIKNYKNDSQSDFLLG